MIKQEAACVAESIEAFVNQLQHQGVLAGQQQAEKIKAEASAEALNIVAQAKEQAEHLLAAAQQQVQLAKQQAEVDLKLACRDAIGKLSDAVTRALVAVLNPPVGEQLSDADFLGKVLHDVVLTYAKADLDQRSSIQINVPQELQEQLSSWAFRQLTENPDTPSFRHLTLKGSLKEAGFEYTRKGATVSVTQSSMVELLVSMVSPRLRESIERAVADAPPAAAGGN
jgi:V/A-type H+/Na+-transporting ATPase subunit E